jgi:hypothetical protein
MPPTDAELLAVVKERLGQLEDIVRALVADVAQNALTAKAEAASWVTVGQDCEYTLNQMATLETRIEKVETHVFALIAQLALTQADVKGLDEDMDELARARDDARRAIARLEAEAAGVAPPPEPPPFDWSGKEQDQR